MIDRRTWTAGALGAWALAGRAAEAPPPAGRILRVLMESPEVGFDPARLGDIYSSRVVSHIFEAAYHYDWLAVPVKVQPLTAAALPEVSADHRTWTVRLRPGIYFADDLAFRGHRRELVAQDYLYAIRRYADPATTSPGYAGLADLGIEGYEEAHDAAVRDRRPFDYDAPIAGLGLLDRYTFQIRLRAPRPRFLATLCDNASLGAVAREVVEHYGDDIVAHPVGTGPYRLKEWRRSSRIVLERNPDFREMVYDAEPAPDDAEALALLARFKGRRLPLNDGVEIAVLTEPQTRWLSFLNGQADIGRVPNDFVQYAMPGGNLAPHLAQRRVSARRYVNADVAFSYFNMDDPIVGGYTADKVALRRAIGMAYNLDRDIRIARRGSAVPAESLVQPGCFGYNASFRTEANAYDPERAKALLDLYGYVDRDGDGWRELPDGRPLVLHMGTQPSQADRQFDEVWQKSLAAIGVRIHFETAQWPENMKAARAGRLQMWFLASTAVTPDGQSVLEFLSGDSIGSGNLARFKLPAFDALYRRMLVLADGPERAALFDEAKKLAIAYMPYKPHVHRLYIDLSHPWAVGWRQGMFRQEAWQYIEVDPALRARLAT